MDYILIPSYEPTEKLVRLIEELKSVRRECRILVVNDGSAPEYDSLFAPVEALGVTLLRHEQTEERSCMRRLCYLLHSEDLIPVVMCDSDGQHKPNDIFFCLDTLKDSLMP
jgi:hypothetical protein